MAQPSTKTSAPLRTRTTRAGVPTSRSGDRLAADSALATSRVKASRVMVNGKAETVSTRPRVALNDKSNNKSSKQSQEQTEAGFSKPGAHARSNSSSQQPTGISSSSSTSTIRPAVGTRGKVRSSATIETNPTRSVTQKNSSNNIAGQRSRSNSSSTTLTSSQPLPRSTSSRTLARTSSHPTVSFQGEPIHETHFHSSQQVSGRSANLGRSAKQSNSMDLDEDDDVEEIEEDDELEELERAVDTDDGSDGELDEEMEDGDSDVSVEERKDDGGSITSTEEPQDHLRSTSALEDQPTDEALSDAESETDSNFSLVLDPDGIVSLSPEMEAAAQAKVAAICARYHQQVLEPNAQQAAIDRAEAVARGEILSENAAHDDELAQMGLDPEEVRDTSMVAEYSKEIFGYMDRCEKETMANPNYMEFQNEIQWHMRATLVDWLLQVHMRYHMLPETLWIGVNIVDRFLSVRVVSLAKLQLVGVTAMFIAAKYEEILAPSVEEFVYMTEGGYSREEILKGERIILATLNFNVSTYCSPYSWVRRISKADDYDIQTRTLSKFLMEVTLLDHRFLRARPSLIAAVGMFLAKKMLAGEWDDAFVYYSSFTEEQLVPGANLLLEKLIDPSFEDQFVCRKYANKKFLKASTFARDWAQRHHSKLMEAASNGNGNGEIV